MNFSAYCIECLVNKQSELAAQQHDEDKALLYMKEVLKAIVSAPENVAAPYLASKFDEIFAELYYPGDRYAEIKQRANQYALQKEQYIRTVVLSADDPLLMGLRFARMGNYLDFGALGHSVDMGVFDELIERGSEETVDPVEYRRFCSDLEKARKLLYIADNTGEIVFDRIFVEQILKYYPKLDLCFAVRGKPTVNDATREDAIEAGIPNLVRLVDSGTAIPGTQIDYISQEMRDELYSADVIFSKGQGNFETMAGCGLNVYYSFLCKCDWFVKLFGVPRLTGMFVNERRLRFPVERP